MFPYFLDDLRKDVKPGDRRKLGDGLALEPLALHCKMFRSFLFPFCKLDMKVADAKLKSLWADLK